MHAVQDELQKRFFDRPDVKLALMEQLKRVEADEITPFEAAEYLLGL